MIFYYISLHIPWFFFGGFKESPKKPCQVFTDISSVALVEAQETFEANHLMVETLLGDFFQPLEGVVVSTGDGKWWKTVGKRVENVGVFFFLENGWVFGFFGFGNFAGTWGVDWLMGVDWLDFLVVMIVK